MPVQLSVNVNKVATLRNSRGGKYPSLSKAVQAILSAGAPGITVHPREDERHITRKDVLALSEQLSPLRDSVEFNIEGDPRPDLMALVRKVRPHQCTLVPVRPGEVTSEAGWNPQEPGGDLMQVISSLKECGIRVSVFVDARTEAVEYAAELGADRIELYTEPYAAAFSKSLEAGKASFKAFASAAQRAGELGLGINAGHDLDLDNLPLFRSLPGLAEVSIGHALVSDALFRGLDPVVRDYLQVLRLPS